MGTSNETFSKREKEKIRLKKKQDKLEKREERKANANKGLELSEMMAYVDENGNISTSPPDPRKIRKIDATSIQLGIPKQEDIVEEAVRQGIVTFFNTSKGYGFIRDQQNQQSVFVHINGLIDAVGENDRVTFEIEMSPKGANAVRVRKYVAAPVAPPEAPVPVAPAEAVAPSESATTPVAEDSVSA